MDQYHGAITASTASSRLLSVSPSIGRYLVRKGPECGDFIISYVENEDDVKHILIPKNSNHSIFLHNPNLHDSPIETHIDYVTSHFQLNCIHPVMKNDFVDNADTPPLPEQTTEDTEEENLKMCNVCDKRVANNATHRKQHSIAFCQLCENVFHKNQFPQHKAICDLSQRKLQCPRCDYETPFHSTLTKHKAKCHGPRPTYPCDQCEETFSSLSRLGNHKIGNHGNRFNCNQCDKSYKNRKHLVEHVKNKHKPQDQGVPAEVVDVAGLQSPPRGVQPAAVRAGSRRPSPPRSTSQPPPSPHRSPSPPALFINLVSMICHTVTSFIMGEDEDDDNEWEFIDPINTTTRQIRIRRPKYACDQCQFTATNKRNIRRHRRIHRVRREFKCQHCDFKRFHRNTVTRHERTCESRPTVQKRMSKKQFWHDITAQVPISNNMAYKLFSSINKVLNIKIFPKWMKLALRSGLNCWKSQLTHCLGMQLICINNQFLVLAPSLVSCYNTDFWF